MRKCKEEFKEFERQDVKYREDFKHMNQKIKKLEDKVQKVMGRHDLLHLSVCMNEMPYSFLFQDSSRIEALVKEGEDSNDMIPKLEDNIPKLQKLLLDEEKVLEEITESSKGRPFSFLTTDILEVGFN
jgi:structural maintenance of chromosome 4